MATMTYTNATPSAKTAGKTAPVARKIGFFRRLVRAMQESRMRQAEIEIRRIRAIVGDNDTGFKHALLPFKGE
jgi:ribosomal protein L18E